MKTVNSTAVTLQCGVNELELLFTSQKLNELHNAKCEGAASHKVDWIPADAAGRLVSAGRCGRYSYLLSPVPLPPPVVGCLPGSPVSLSHSAMLAAVLLLAGPALALQQLLITAQEESSNPVFEVYSAAADRVTTVEKQLGVGRAGAGAGAGLATITVQDSMWIRDRCEDRERERGGNMTDCPPSGWTPLLLNNLSTESIL